MTDRDLMQQALEALEFFWDNGYRNIATKQKVTMNALRERLAQPEQEPVATVTNESGNPNLSMSWWHEPALPIGTKIYTSPQPKKQWVGLNHFDRTLLRTTYAPLKRLHHIKETNTDIVEEIINDWDVFFTAIEAKLKEKNTYDAAATIRSRG